ncbi:NAD(P)H-dependent oxidoreductase [Actinocorallia aurea]
MKLRTAIIIGSVREGRAAPAVARWLAGEAARRDDLELDVIDLLETPVPERLHAYDGDRLAALSPRLAAADAFIVVTPEYNKSFPSALKDLLDWHMAEWQAKPVGFVSYGGMSGGLRAVEQLRLIFTELHAVTIRDTVSFHGVWDRFDADGAPVDPEGVSAAAKTLLDQLAWWGLALRDARAARPYAS